MKTISKAGLAKAGTLLVSVVWPFFLKNIWPLVKDQVIEILQKAMTFLGDAISAKINERANIREKEAYARAQQAERKAALSQNDIEIAKYQAQAEAWRQVADELRQDNERLRQELTSIVASASTQAETSLRGIQIEVTSETARLTTDGKIIMLPAPIQE